MPDAVFTFAELDSARPGDGGFWHCSICCESSMDDCAQGGRPFYLTREDGLDYPVCVECLDQWMTPEP